MSAGILAIAGLASLVFGWLLGFILPSGGLFDWGLIALGGSLVITALVIDFRQVRRAIAGRRGRVGISATVRVSLFAGIVVLANAISVGTFHRFDLTGLAQFTLTSQTKDVLARLETPVEIVTFFTADSAGPIQSFAQSLLAEYRIHSDRLTVRAIDPDVSPDQARQYGIDRGGALLGTVAFTGHAGRRLVYGPQIVEAAEHTFTGALLEVTGQKQKVVYFLTGHGEGGITSTYSRARDGLRDNLFQVAAIDLLRAPEIPADAAVVVLAAPRRPLAEGEMRALGEFLASGGRLMVLADPNPTGDLRRLLGDWWLDIADGHLVDPTSHVVPNVDNVLVPRTRNSFGLPETYFPGATALISRSEIPSSIEVTALVWSSPESWLESDRQSGISATFDPDQDRMGPLAIGALVRVVPAEEGSSKGTRLAVFGDSDFASDRHFVNGGNGSLFLSVANWLADGREVIAIDRKVLAIRRLILSPDEARFLHVASIGLLPSLLLVAAAVAWWRRRLS